MKENKKKSGEKNEQFSVVRVKSSKSGGKGRNNSAIQTPVYTIHKSEFRNTVQMLTGSQSPSTDANQNSTEQTLNEPSRLRQIRPPPLFGFDSFSSRDSNPRPPVAAQFPFPSAIDAFWANLAVNSRQQAQQHVPASPVQSRWADYSVPSLDRTSSVPAFPSPGSRCLPSPSFLSSIPSPSGIPNDFYSVSPSSYPHGHM